MADGRLASDVSSQRMADGRLASDVSSQRMSDAECQQSAGSGRLLVGRGSSRLLRGSQSAGSRLLLLLECRLTAGWQQSADGS